MPGKRLLNFQKGFTLLELLVVIAIIGLLTSIVATALNTARQKTRDTRRLTDLKQVKTAFDLYLSEGNGYPDASLFVAGNTVTCSGQTIIRIPRDPLSPTYDYSYTTSGTSNLVSACGGATVWPRYTLQFFMENKGAFYTMDEDGKVRDGLGNLVSFDSLLK